MMDPQGVPGGMAPPAMDAPRLLSGAGECPAGEPEAVTGLTATDARERLARFGPNEIESGQRFLVLRTLLQFMANPLVLILLVASLVSGLLGEISTPR